MRNVRIGWLIILVLAVGLGCGDKNSVPSGVLSKNEMQNVLWDMILADQYSGYLPKDSTHIDVKMENLRLYDQVFQLHHISREEFTRSYKYYMTRPDLTQTLLDSIAAMGNRLRAENYTRPTPMPTPAAHPAGLPAPTPPHPKADTMRKRPPVLPVTPMRLLPKHPDSAHKQKLAES